MLRCLVCAILILLGIGDTAAAQCAPRPDFKVDMTVRQTPLRFDRSLGIPELTRRMKGQGPDGPALGLTQSRLSTEMSTAMLAQPSGDGFCVALDRVTVEITLDLTVYLATELEAGSCVYREAEKHEQKHVDLERKLLPLARTRVETVLNGIAKRIATGATADAAGDKLQRRAKTAVDKVLNDFAAEKKRQQLKFDTIAEYRKLTRACSAEEIRQLLGG